MIAWEKITREESILIHKIALRAVKMSCPIYKGLVQRNLATTSLRAIEMDITACHLSNPLNLSGLLKAKDSDFGHDVFGINRFINRETGELAGCFSPRYSKEIL